MRVYFVRHGETILNTHHRHQYPSTPLRADRVHVVEKTARALSSYNPTHIVTSPYTRARETARIISMVCKKSTDESVLFEEFVRPTSLQGTSHFSFRTIRYVLACLVHRKDPQWRYEDGENLHDLNRRIGGARAYLESLSESHTDVVVVSHFIFISALCLHLCNKDEITLFDIMRIALRKRSIPNASIQCAEFVKTTAPETCAWQLCSFPPQRLDS